MICRNYHYYSFLVLVAHNQLQKHMVNFELTLDLKEGSGI